MKTANFVQILSVIFSLFISDCIISQPCSPVWTSHSLKIFNNTNCDFLVSWEAGELGICDGCAGAAETVPALSNITSIGYNCGAPLCTNQVINTIIWAIAEPVLTGSCNVTSDAQAFDCGGGSPISGTGTNCCINSWSVTITNLNRIDVN